MKKAIAILLVVMLVVSMAPAAFASTTTLTTNVPDATYKFSIPADTKIEYNALDTGIGYVEVTESAGFATGKNLEISIEYGPFINDANPEATIPYTICADYASSTSESAPATSHSNHYLTSGNSITFKGMNNGKVARLAFISSSYTGSSMIYNYCGDLGVRIDSESWGKALGGDYTSTITFTAKVVQEK